MQSASHFKRRKVRITWARWQPARFESSLSKLVFRKEAKCRVSRARETEPAEKSSQQQKHQTFFGTPYNTFPKYFGIKPSVNWKRGLQAQRAPFALVGATHRLLLQSLAVLRSSEAVGTCFTPMPWRTNCNNVPALRQVCLIQPSKHSHFTMSTEGVMHIRSLPFCCAFNAEVTFESIP